MTLDIDNRNLLLSNDNVVKLADLGESKDIKDDPEAHNGCPIMIRTNFELNYLMNQ